MRNRRVSGYKEENRVQFEGERIRRSAAKGTVLDYTRQLSEGFET